jgi:hypothetical protein
MEGEEDMRDRRIFRLLTAAGLAVLVSLASPAAAQVNTGTLEVLTTDQEALAMPGVPVRVVNADTGAQRATVSDATGLAVV